MSDLMTAWLSDQLQWRTDLTDWYDWLTDSISHWEGGGGFLIKLYDGGTRRLPKGWKLMQILVSLRVFKSPLLESPHN